MDEDFIWIIADEPLTPQNPSSQPTGGRDEVQSNPFAKGQVAPTTNALANRSRVSVEALEQSMTAFLQRLGRIFRQAHRSAGELAEMELDEIELAIEISGEGQVSLLGNGGKAAGKGAITLKFKKTHTQRS